MKKLLVSVAAFVLAVPMFAQSAQQRLAVIDVQKVLQNSSAGKQAYERLKKMQDERIGLDHIDRAPHLIHAIAVIQLHSADVKPGVTRRALMAASPLFCLPVPAMAQVDGTAVDIHSHAGNLIRASFGRDSLLDVAGPMRKGGQQPKSAPRSKTT